MQTILGAGGPVGTALAKALPTYTNDIRLVSRHPEKIHPGDQLFPADLLQAEDVDAAVRGSEIVYLTVGFPYNRKIWEKAWPVVISNVLAACQQHGAKLAFFDNVYMYDPDYLDNMTEETPIRPVSKKGEIRAAIARQVAEAGEKGDVQTLILRSADFYGPGIRNSVLEESVVKPLRAGKTANWFGSLDCKHSFTYTPDAGKAMALLGNSPEAYGQVWHAPTAAEPPTGREWVNAIATELGVKPKARATSKGMLRFLGIFIPLLREMPEMFYQYDRDYVFSSEKVEQAYHIKPTPYAEGIRATAVGQ